MPRNGRGAAGTAPQYNLTTVTVLDRAVSCDNCGAEVARQDAYALERFQGRRPVVCPSCLEDLARAMGAVVRATTRRAA
jgi:DNA-directed RNA polymerase subunit RPC12/RpoP